MSDPDRDELDIGLSSLSLNVNMVGISLAIFTFLLFFYYTTSAARDPMLLQLTLGVNVAAVFSFAIAGLYSYVLLYSSPAKHPDVGRHRTRSAVFFSIGLVALLLEPSLILFSTDLIVPALASARDM